MSATEFSRRSAPAPAYAARSASAIARVGAVVAAISVQLWGASALAHPSPQRPAALNQTLNQTLTQTLLTVESASPNDAASRGDLSPDHLQVGRLSLRRCRVSRGYCGEILQPLDPSGQVPGFIPIHFEYYPHRNPDQPRSGVIVAVEGGPGYASTLSASLYRGIFEPLMDSHDLLMVDNRGTGSSQAINCPGLQNHYPPTQATIRACGEHLGISSDLFGTGLAADDMAAVLSALQLPPVDLYGDSYGTYFGQTFAGRHPEWLHSLILDGAFEVKGLSPWYPANAHTMREAFNKVCSRAASCDAQISNTPPSNTLDRVQTLLEQLRVLPISGIAPDGNGQLVAATLDPSALAYLMFAAAYGPLNYRELDPAIRAYLEHGDSAPLLRMRAETYTFADPYNLIGRPRFLSEGLYLATSCTDYPQIYDMRLPVPLRVLQRNAAIAAMQATHPDLDAPFSISEFNAMPIDMSLLDLCLAWPMPSPAHPTQQPIPPNHPYPDIPVLVLTGEMDSLTSPISGDIVAAEFPHSRHVVIANSFHVTAEADPYRCADQIVQNFIATQTPGDTRCAEEITEIRPLPYFAQTVSEAEPATALAGNLGTEVDLKLAAVLALTAGDAANRWWSSTTYSGLGLRGGQFTITTPELGVYVHTLSGYTLVNNVPVSGTVRWNYATGLSHAELTIDANAAGTGTLSIDWNAHQAHATAQLSGTLNGHRILATMVAPN